MLLAVSEALAENKAPTSSQSKDFNCDCIPRIGTGLAGGIGLHGEVCGALVGGVLMIGLLYGADAPDDDIKYALSAVSDVKLQLYEVDFILKSQTI